MEGHNGVLCSSVLLKFLIYLLAPGRYIASQETGLWFSTGVTDISILLTNYLLFLIFSQIMTLLAAHLLTPNNIMVFSPSSHIPVCPWPPAGHSNLAAHYSNCIHLAVDNYVLLSGFCCSWIQTSPLMLQFKLLYLPAMTSFEVLFFHKTILSTYPSIPTLN